MTEKTTAQSNTPDLSHLSPRLRERLEAEMNSGRDRQQAHAKTFNAVQKQAKQMEDDGNPVAVDPAEIVARRLAGEKVIDAAGKDAQREAVQKQAEKEARDFNESIGVTTPFEDKVVDEAERLSQERLDQSPVHVEASHVGEGQDEARVANAAKEVADRVNSTNNQGNTVFQGVTGAVDTGPRYDDDGNLIENETPENVQAPYQERTDAPADIALEQAAEPVKRKRGRPAATPAHAVGDGPKSE